MEVEDPRPVTEDKVEVLEMVLPIPTEVILISVPAVQVSVPPIPAELIHLALPLASEERM